MNESQKKIAGTRIAKALSKHETRTGKYMTANGIKSGVGVCDMIIDILREVRDAPEQQ